MANDNKKINELVSESDEDTSELEMLSDAMLRDDDIEFEADAATQAFESLGKSDNDSIAALRAELSERDGNIERLEYDLEQLRSRSKGQQKELEARTELTAKLAGELEQQNGLLRDVTDQLEDRERRLTDVESRSVELESRIRESSEQLETARKDAHTATTSYEKLERQHDSDSKELAELRTSLAEEQARRQWAEDAEKALGVRVTEFEGEQRAFRESVASLRDYIEGRKIRWEQQQTRLETSEAALRTQQKTVERLTRDVRHSTERLDREKTARQELQTRLDATEKESASRHGTISKLRRAVTEKDDALKALREEVDDLSNRFDETSGARRQGETELQAARSELADMRGATTELRSKLDALSQDVADKDRLLEEKSQAIASLEEQVARALAELGEERQRRTELDTRLEEEQRSRRQLDHERNELSADVDNLRAEVEQLSGIASNAAAFEASNAQLEGLVASQEAALAELHEQLRKTEGYADTLRDKMQHQLTVVESENARNKRLKDSLDSATKRLDELAADLAREKQRNSELSTGLRATEKRFQEEMQQIRSELDAAQKTIADGRDMNDKLTAELADNTEHRTSLEAQLAKADETRQSEVRKLGDELAILKLKLDDYEHKLSDKDAALKALLSEFATKPKKPVVPSDERPDSGVHRLPRRTGAHDETGAPDRDRVTRLLVGTIDGQKLRFPLFKDKLTIGRTAHNDIQIKAQFISRRHAVIVTEDEQTKIVDWGSKNGIYVNGQRVTETALRSGDLVTVGTAEFVFEERPKR